jgi:hypothetical protein
LLSNSDVPIGKLVLRGVMSEKLMESIWKTCLVKSFSRLPASSLGRADAERRQLRCTGFEIAAQRVDSVTP